MGANTAARDNMTTPRGGAEERGHVEVIGCSTSTGGPPETPHTKLPNTPLRPGATATVPPPRRAGA